MQNTNRKENMKKIKMPKHYFSFNDGTPSGELSECIIDECEAAGLDIQENENIAKKCGYDYTFTVTNPAAEKLKQIKEICLVNAKNWNETEHDPVEEFKLMVKIINEKH